jgi:hypothetical protein
MNNIIAEAAMVECNHGGIEIGNIKSDGLYWRRNWGEGCITEWKEAEIHYSNMDNDDEPFEDEVSQAYFIIGNVDDEGKEWMYFLNDFMPYDR